MTRKHILEKNGLFKFVMIEPTNICNLKCLACPARGGYHDRKPRGEMHFEGFKKIIDECTFVSHIRLWGGGEPFLAQDIVKMVNYAGKRRIPVEIHTNGTILTDKITGNLDVYKLRISFSIDGTKQQTYGLYRKGGLLRDALRNISCLVKKRENLRGLRIVWQFLLMSHNENEVGDAERLARNIGVDEFVVRKAYINKQHTSRYDFLLSKKGQLGNGGYKKSHICRYIYPGDPVILWNGDVAPCCQYYAEKHIMGNALEENLVDVWQSPQYVAFRNGYMNRSNKLCVSECKFASNLEAYEKVVIFNK